MQDYRKLTVWQASRRLTHSVYRFSEGFPRAERFGLVTQMRRSAISVSSNIAEGCGRGSQRELARFLSIASGSAHELESQLILATDLGFGDTQFQRELANDVLEMKSMLTALRQAVQRTI